MSKLSRQFLRNLKLLKKVDFDINIFSAEIDNGLFDKPRFSLFSHLQKVDDIEFLEVDHVLVRINLYEGNFRDAFDYSLITQMFPKKFSKMPYAIQFLDELYTTYVSILLLLKRDKDASLLLEQAKRICLHLDMKFTFAKLDLIAISLLIRDKQLFDTQKQLSQC